MKRVTSISANAVIGGGVCFTPEYLGERERKKRQGVGRRAGEMKARIGERQKLSKDRVKDRKRERRKSAIQTLELQCFYLENM